MAEALIKNRFLNVEVYSAGTKPAGKINPNAIKVLKLLGYWQDEFYSKDISTVLKIDFDLVVTVCDNAKENCPVFPKKTDILHIGFKDPEGKDFEEFKRTIDEMQIRIISEIEKYLENHK